MRDKILKTLIAIQLLLFPFLDIIRTTNFRHFEIIGISVIELVNIVLIGVCLILTISKIFKTRKKHILALFLYLILCLAYIVFHYQHIITFDVSIFERANFNFIVETFYICRVYILPILLLFVLIENKDLFTKEFYFKIITIIIAIMSFSIIFLNIFKISYISYSPTHDFVTHNLFDYFLYSGDYKLLSSRGWFDSANELSAILLMFLPFNIYLLYKNTSKFNIILFASQFLAMILLGTRTSAVGAVLVSVVVFIGYLFFILIKKEEINLQFLKPFIVVSLICTAYMLISPFMFGRINDSNFDFSVQNPKAYAELKNIKEDDISALFEKYKDEFLINEQFLKMYPLENDKEFWFKMASRDRALNNNSRVMKIDIIKRVKERNDNIGDDYLGMGYTLNFMDIERDYVYQYYIFGILGIILFIAPYMIFIIYAFIKALQKLNSNLKLITLIGFMAPCLGLVAAYLSGHVFGWVSPMMYLVMFCAILVLIISENKEETYEK